MAETSKIVDGAVEVTRTADVVVTTMTKDEVIGKRAEAQTKVDHLNIDLVAAQAEVTKWDNLIQELVK